MEDDKAVLMGGEDDGAAEVKDSAAAEEIGTAAKSGSPEGSMPSPESAEEKHAAQDVAGAEEKEPQAADASPFVGIDQETDAGMEEAPYTGEGMPSNPEREHAVKTRKMLIMYVAAAVIVAVILFGFYNQLRYLAVSPGSLPQAGDARFYENFIYNNSYLIPSSCLVFSYDPTLFNINNRTATQFSYLYDKQEYAAYLKNYSCLVVDYGYWCYTPNNICTYAKSDFILSTIAKATYNQTNTTYSLYKVVGLNASS
jgi:hypothetical protein